MSRPTCSRVRLKYLLAASAHFLENHDEPRIAPLLDSPAQHRAPPPCSSSALPGMRFLYEGQFSGWRAASDPRPAGRWPERTGQRRNPGPLRATRWAAIKDSAVGRWRSHAPPAHRLADNSSSSRMSWSFIGKNLSRLNLILVVINLGPAPQPMPLRATSRARPRQKPVANARLPQRRALPTLRRRPCQPRALSRPPRPITPKSSASSRNRPERFAGRLNFP